MPTGPSHEAINSDSLYPRPGGMLTTNLPTLPTIAVGAADGQPNHTPPAMYQKGRRMKPRLIGQVPESFDTQCFSSNIWDDGFHVLQYSSEAQVPRPLDGSPIVNANWTLESLKVAVAQKVDGRCTHCNMFGHLAPKCQNGSISERFFRPVFSILNCHKCRR
ncbi:hypothetical protein BU16DRAFT_557439 [Lophium mytilinum]|uniref:Uncharacterized protein n=1 Tax=Lophium mytilinum TaxID=390894 RepID=A0A6A6R2Z4_9PEZI|nr:hypothetical protein BU16DRAFT_557439 [Lophium mytilinum]